ncbi:LysE family translocator [Salinarimonas sp.]|uniref:LysE family translocator n=1 Tax=Salinarimonas sp. TaxID=2766526 RepID=UPI0032D97249
MPLETLIALLAFLFPLAYSPGPGNGFFAALGAAGGLRAAWPALAGYHVATFAVTALIGLGVGLALLADPAVATALRVAGAAYVAWLGIAFLRAAHRPENGGGIGRAVRGRFVDGAALLVLNPKAYMIIGLLFTQFLGPADDRLGRVLALSAVFTLNNLVAFVVWTLAGMALARLLASAGDGRTVNAVFAASLIGVSIWMLVG